MVNQLYRTVVRSRHIWKWTMEIIRDIRENEDAVSEPEVLSWTKLKAKLEAKLQH